MNIDILKRFDALNVWKQGEQRAPHKPLLVLYALARWQQGKTELTFIETEPELTKLLREFGPPRKSDHPEQPFWRLQNDGVWTVHAPHDLPLKTGDQAGGPDVESNGLALCVLHHKTFDRGVFTVSQGYGSADHCSIQAA